MKKHTLRGASVLLIMGLALAFAGCSHDPDTPDNPQPTGGTLQSYIDAAQTGGTVTLNSTMEGDSIVISRAMTVNGGGLSNINITVSSAVRNAVTLRNFRNARVTVSASSSPSTNVLPRAAISREAEEEEEEKFKKLGDDALPLHIEDCTIEKFEAMDDVALYLENGEKKSEIEELYLKEGVEDFTFIEFDENGKEVADKSATPTADKSKVEKLIIEDEGIDKINLIGGVISDVDFADGVTVSDIEALKYDKEFSDQFGAAAKTDFFDVIPNAKKEDVGVAEWTGNSTIYRLEMSRDVFEKVNGAFSIMFLTDNQISKFQNGDNASTIATFAEPMYIAIPAGCFKVDFDGSETSGTVKTVYGTEWAYVDYAHAFARGLVWNYGLEDIVVLDHYRNYNKNAFVAKFDSNNVTIYVNMAEIKKGDVICCAYSENDEAYGESATKLTDLDLSNYKPYFTYSLNTMQYFYAEANPSPETPEGYGTIDSVTQAHDEAVAQYQNTRNEYFAVFEDGNTPFTRLTYNGSSQAQGAIQFWPPYGASLKLLYELSDCPIITMIAGGSYPTVPANYPSIETPHCGTTDLHPLQDQTWD